MTSLLPPSTQEMRLFIILPLPRNIFEIHILPTIPELKFCHGDLQALHVLKEYFYTIVPVS